ncbi:glycosyltransferase [Candidatus Woesebacteria bacterium]|nr:glycosyltransferase [Candidatus Woesebacteria bacterium]
MKILMLTPYLPFPLHSGGQIRTYNLLKHLSTKHQVTLFALIKDDSEKQYIPELEKYCAKVEVFKRSRKPFTFTNIIKTALSSYPFLVIRNYVSLVRDAVITELEVTDYDVIHAETFYMMPHLPRTTIPILLVEQTIEYLGYESYAKIAPKFLQKILQMDIYKIKKWEKFFWNYCDQLVVMSEEDKNFIGKEIGQRDKIEVVENGVDTAWFAQIPRKEPITPTILSVGTFKWLPNIEAVTFLVEKVWPLIKQKLPEVKLWIVGAAPTTKVLNFGETDPQITVTGNIPDIRTAFTQSHALVAPVFSGKGTRYKILEALASGTPVIATETAVEGIGVIHGTHALLSNTAEGLAQLVDELLNSKKLRDRLAKNGREYVHKNFDWKLISQKLDIIYQRIGTKQ